MKDFLTFIAILPILKVIEFLPLSISVKFCRFLFWSLMPIFKKRIKIAEKNLEIAFPEMSDPERIKIARSSFLNLSEVLAFITKLRHFNSRERVSEILSVENIEILKKLKEDGRKIIFVTAHFSVWELLPLASILLGLRLSIVYRPPDNKFFDRYLKKRRGFTSLITPISKKGGVKEILKSLKKGDVVGILIDQNVLKGEGVFINFFGKKASTSPIVPLLALRTSAAVVPVFVLPEERGKRYKILILNEVQMENCDERDEFLIKNTQKIMDVFEDMIRKYPENWLWIHRRWKTRPPEEDKKN